MSPAAGRRGRPAAGGGGGGGRGGRGAGGPGGRGPTAKGGKAAKAGGRGAGGGAGAGRSGSGGARPGSSRAGGAKGPGARGGAPTGSGAPGRTVGGRGGRDEGPARRSAATRGLGGEQVEGRQAVRELLLAGRRKVSEVWIATEPDERVELDDLAELAMGLGVPVRPVSRAKLAGTARTDAPQGVLAKARPLPEATLEELARPVGGTPPFLLLLDGVTDPGNLGALLRSAECAGVTGVVLPRHRAVHVTPTVTKAAAGAVEYLPMAVVGGLPTAIAELQRAGVWVVGLDAGGDTSLFDLPVADEPVALVLGAEGAGLSRLVRQRCDTVAAIPLGGRLGSLNVSVAGALACFEIVRRRRA